LQRWQRLGGHRHKQVWDLLLLLLLLLLDRRVLASLLQHCVRGCDAQAQFSLQLTGHTCCPGCAWTVPHVAPWRRWPTSLAVAGRAGWALRCCHLRCCQAGMPGLFSGVVLLLVQTGVVDPLGSVYHLASLCHAAA
jgi:hypothetical protein